MPAKDTFGSQPPLELIRQWVDYGFWYDRMKQTVKHVKVKRSQPSYYIHCVFIEVFIHERDYIVNSLIIHKENTKEIMSEKIFRATENLTLIFYPYIRCIFKTTSKIGL